MGTIILKIAQRIPFLYFLLRVQQAAKYYNQRYLQILKWGFTSRENTNYTYDLTEENLNYLASTISLVTNKPFKEIMGYLNEPQNNKELTQFVIEKTKKSKFRGSADARCNFGKRLGWYAFARALKPKVVIETGIDKGLGGVLLCEAILKNQTEGFKGKYYGTDINPEAGYLIDGKYKDAGEILVGDSIKSLKKFKSKIDLFINDSDHSAKYEYDEYQTIKAKLSPKGIILGDNSHATDSLFRFSNETKRNFLFFKEVPKDHWYPGGGIGISFKP